ncbi:glucoamylase [Clostridium acetobutylicum]|nr:glucoamylase [Clostridium acetobutylicum]
MKTKSIMQKVALVLLSFTFSASIVGITPSRTMAEETSFNIHHSLETLTTSNGLAAATYSEKDRKLNRFQPHIYSNYDANTSTKNYLSDAYFGYKINEKSTWLTGVPITSVNYVNGTNIINTVQKDGNFQFESYYFTPFSGDKESRMLVMLVKATNNGQDQKDFSLYSEQNLNLGGNEDNKEERSYYNKRKGYLKEYKGDNIAIYKNINQEGSHYTSGTGENSPVEITNRGGHYLDKTTLKADNLVCGYENRNKCGDIFKKGTSRWYGVVIGLTEDGNEKKLSKDVNYLVNNKNPENLLQNEKNWWNQWHQGEIVPKGLSASEQAVYRQSTAVLKMAQCREHGKSHGQILASLIPGMWSIAWVRDGVYSIQALLASGHTKEAKEGLKFMLNADMRKDETNPTKNYYQRYIESTNKGAPVYGLGVDLGTNYAISVCRYYGNGTEESDKNDNGYNVETDGWGLVLWAVDSYINKTGDKSFLNKYWNTLSKHDADLLVKLVDSKDGLMQPDSSIWEEHWTPYKVGNGIRQRFAYTNITTYNGLKAAAHLATLNKDKQKKELYNEKADSIKDALLNKMVVKSNVTGKNTLGSSLEKISEGTGYHDAAVVEAINFGLVNPKDPLASGIIDSFNSTLRMKSGSPGYMRNQDGGDYDSNEWAFVDLRVATALKNMGKDKESKVLIDWLTDQAHANFDLIPELLTRNNSDYFGSIPMAGFGSGSYILSINNYYNNLRY